MGLQKSKLWAGHEFAAGSCCDFDLQDSDQNVARDMSSQYGDHFCEIVVKSIFKGPSYGADTILLQSHAVTLTFNVGSKQNDVHTCIVHIATNLRTKF